MADDIESLLTGSDDQHPEEKRDSNVGQLVNENATLRRELDSLRAELEALKAQSTAPTYSAPPQPQSAQDPAQQWRDYLAKEVMANIPREKFLVDTQGAVLDALAHTLTKVTPWFDALATQRGMENAIAMRADLEFSQMFPDLTRTEVGQMAVRNAIAELSPRPDFQRLLRSPATRYQAYQRIGQRAREWLGQEGVSSPAAPEPEKGTVSLTGGRFPGGSAIPQETPRERHIADVVDYVMGKRK
jgi:hypothetical protein